MAKMTLEKKKAAILELCQYGDSIKENKTIATSVINKRLDYVPSKKLYKFRTCTDKNFKTLEENCVWMSSASSFLDLFDCTINIDILKTKMKLKVGYIVVTPYCAMTYQNIFLSKEG